jgi:hypothetical protein
MVCVTPSVSPITPHLCFQSTIYHLIVGIAAARSIGEDETWPEIDWRRHKIKRGSGRSPFGARRQPTSNGDRDGSGALTIGCGGRCRGFPATRPPRDFAHGAQGRVSTAFEPRGRVEPLAPPAGEADQFFGCSFWVSPPGVSVAGAAPSAAGAGVAPGSAAPSVAGAGVAAAGAGAVMMRA